MGDATESHLLKRHEGPAARVLNPAGAGAVVLVCEHASRFIPQALGNLGLDAEAEISHAAWDIGAMDLALELMAVLDAPLVFSRVSRLVYDCNRPPEAADAMPERVERYDIPGNLDLTPTDRERRIAEVYRPFHALLTRTLAGRDGPTALITIHSFTPVYRGRFRDVELGLLHDSDAALAEAMMVRACDLTRLKAALNQPYSAADGVTHTLREHAVAARLPNAMIEVRNDLIDTPAGVRRVAGGLAELIGATVRKAAEAVG